MRWLLIYCDIKFLVTMITPLLFLLLPKTFLSLYGGKETPCECLPKSYHKAKDKDHVSSIIDHAEFVLLKPQIPES